MYLNHKALSCLVSRNARTALRIKSQCFTWNASNTPGVVSDKCSKDIHICIRVLKRTCDSIFQQYCKTRRKCEHRKYYQAVPYHFLASCRCRFRKQLFWRTNHSWHNSIMKCCFLFSCFFQNLKGKQSTHWFMKLINSTHWFHFKIKHYGYLQLRFFGFFFFFK